MIKFILTVATIICFALHPFAQSVVFSINTGNEAQVMDNFGASGAWFSENIGKNWEAAKKDRMAELLFSKGFDQKGQPLGIGLSAWRFNIGGGTFEQGDSSGIKEKERRVESFLAPSGLYNWKKQPGYLWFVKKAVDYKVENLIAFSNTPPVQFTKNGLGFKLEKDYQTNLREDKYPAFADFLVTVVDSLKQQGIHFNYISPVNEPQWDWQNRFGQMNQEGSPWLNKDIARIAIVLDSVLTARKQSTKILLPEAGILTALYQGNGHASKQIQHLFAKDSAHFIGKLPHMIPVVAGHSYFTELGDSNMIHVRQQLRDSCKAYGISFWQSEYCMLGDGYKDGATGNIKAIDCALFLAKVIYHDLVIANASAWQYWNAWEPGSAAENTRYYLLALNKKAQADSANFSITKNLWALGQYSRFIRPGMKRLITGRSDKLNDFSAAKDIMFCAFHNDAQTVAVAVNYTNAERKIDITVEGNKMVDTRNMTAYMTSGLPQENLSPRPLSSLTNIILQPRSIVTFVLKNK